MADQVIHSLVSSLNSKFKILYSKTYTARFEPYNAGTIGTKAAQKSFDLSSDIATYGDVESVFISHIDYSEIANYQAFINGQSLYVNAYRSVPEAQPAYSVVVTVTYAKQA